MNHLGSIRQLQLPQHLTVYGLKEPVRFVIGFHKRVYLFYGAKLQRVCPLVSSVEHNVPSRAPYDAGTCPFFKL